MCIRVRNITYISMKEMSKGIAHLISLVLMYYHDLSLFFELGNFFFSQPRLFFLISKLLVYIQNSLDFN